MHLPPHLPGHGRSHHAGSEAAKWGLATSPTTLQQAREADATMSPCWDYDQPAPHLFPPPYFPSKP